MNAADPRHGKRAGYLAGCRCEPCRVAHTRYCKAYVLRGKRLTVSADRARAHVAELLTHMTVQGIAEASGLSHSTIRKVQSGGRIHTTTAARVLAVRPVVAGAWVPVRGVQRRVQALNALGYPMRLIAERAGLCENEVRKIALAGDRHVTAATAHAICRVYDEWSMRPPTPTTRPERSAVGRARNHAAARGYVPPLGWDDIDSDPHPAATARDEGDALVADLEWLADTGVDIDRAAARLGMHPDSIERRAYRSGRHDLMRRLRANGRSAA